MGEQRLDRLDRGAERSARDKKTLPVRLLGGIAALLPGDYLKTSLFLYGISRPRKIARLVLNRFYRMEHIYEVLAEAKRHYSGPLSILEFGTHRGYAFTKMLYAIRYMKMEERVTVHGFDSFQGMPAPANDADINPAFKGHNWHQGQFHGSADELEAYCEQRFYSNFKLHKGFFEQTLTEERLAFLRHQPPVLVWIDCDYYSSAHTVFERILPYLPNGCVIYFDEYEWAFGSRFSGESKLVYEVNHGKFGDVELILDQELALDSRRVYRFMRKDGVFFPMGAEYVEEQGRGPTNGSPLP